MSERAEFRGKPSWLKKQTYKGAAKAGIAYERKIGRFLKRRFKKAKVTSGQWAVWNGDWYCIDHIVDFEKCAWVVECKLNWKPSAEQKLRNVYGPIVEDVLEKPVVLVQMCKWPRDCEDFITLSMVPTSGYCVVHEMGT